MLPRALWLYCLAAVHTLAQSTVSSLSLSSASNGAIVLSGTNSFTDDNILPTGSRVTYVSYGSQRTISSTASNPAATSASNATASGTASTTSSPRGTTQAVALLAGSVGLITQSIINGTVTLGANTTAASASASASSTTSTVLNTQPCNNYPELCERKYSNITEVCAHNSPFVKAGNAASNQNLPVLNQLNDGIRMLQGQTHFENNTLFYCHTSCSLLNAGTMEAYLATVASWVRTHPYDVVTILIGNADFIGVGNYTAPIQASGLGPYLYEPPYIPMKLNDWPTLSEMILTQKRVVLFMDYNADQTTVPYIFDEFSQLWETPFSPTNVSFPCNTQRPPGLDRNQSLERMYMANHNLNAEINFLGASLLLPNTAQINQTNAVSGFSSLGLMANTCTTDWNRPPNFLLVDFYDVGNGSVFEVAAQHNNVTYNRPCCGVATSAAPSPFTTPSLLAASMAALAALAALL
ncbi:hypothetical protein B0A49_05423 [Cryomyces minteri]|uniref:Secreted protein n=1 Tax=Cryomyces minteri TaxID=331657 RepID=A0A4U0XF52_9PEZI|nr:hypothetical protein B0A49_05423 [Cryomyces minteri]